MKGILLLLWPFRALWLTVHFNRKFGSEVAESTGKGRLRQVIEQVTLALTDFVPPRAYYQYALYRDERRKLAPQFLHNHERNAVCRWIDGYAHCDDIQDKFRFAKACRENELTTVPILAVASDGELLQATGDVVGEQSPCTILPSQDLFVKPRCGYRGEDALCWRYLGTGRFESATGTVLSAEGLLVELCQQSRRQALIIQPCLKNHPTVADLSNGTLSTVRIVTGRDVSNQIKLIAATFKMPVGRDVISTHGLNSPVDLSSGTLGPACRYRAVDTWRDHYPDTGGNITSRTLPDWKEAVALVKRAHSVFTTHAFLGWDVALTSDGPVLLEGNIGWDVVTVQKPQGIPLCNTPFADICLALLIQKARNGDRFGSEGPNRSTSPSAKAA